MMRVILFLCGLACLSSCSPLSKSALHKRFIDVENSLQDHTGFILIDPAKNKTVYEYNSHKYFTPASNTKIFTLFASLKILGDSVPAFHALETPDSLILWGTGDPSFLYKNVYHDPKVFNYLSNASKPLYLSTSNFHTSAFGSGWSWDDYNDYYSSERSPFPVYGNIFTVKMETDSPKIYPAYFQKYLSRGGEKERNQFIREVYSNDFTFHPGKRKSSTTEWSIPIRIDQEMIATLLSDTLKKSVKEIHRAFPDSLNKQNLKTLYSIHVDSLYRVLMQDSDNFIAEQLLLLCSDILSDSLQPEITIKYVKENFLKDLPDEPSWVDGSGLSRYNLFTPRSVARLWKKIIEIAPKERLFPLLATGGKYGTIKNWYKGDEPYVFGKTGSLSNVHCLSGFIVTKSGKTLIFSYMSNNFVQSTTKVRNNMQDLLKLIYERY
jgi:serine-type D-Ala-D-Ala carboxypeptidase/endopeptidase (penicillin-binding protein 4)